MTPKVRVRQKIRMSYVAGPRDSWICPSFTDDLGGNPISTPLRVPRVIEIYGLELLVLAELR
jgi:hypothetical protein